MSYLLIRYFSIYSAVRQYLHVLNLSKVTEVNNWNRILIIWWTRYIHESNSHKSTISSASSAGTGAIVQFFLNYWNRCVQKVVVPIKVVLKYYTRYTMYATLSSLMLYHDWISSCCMLLFSTCEELRSYSQSSSRTVAKKIFF